MDYSANSIQDTNHEEKQMPLATDQLNRAYELLGIPANECGDYTSGCIYCGETMTADKNDTTEMAKLNYFVEHHPYGCEHNPLTAAEKVDAAHDYAILIAHGETNDHS